MCSGTEQNLYLLGRDSDFHRSRFLLSGSRDVRLRPKTQIRTEQTLSQLFLCDRHASSIAAAGIFDVQESTTPLLNGRFVVSVPDGVPITGNPTVVGNTSTAGSLIYERAAGYLVMFAPFTVCVTDDLLDTSDVDLTNSRGGNFGARGCMVLEPGGVFQSQATALGSSPSQAILTWVTYNYVELDASNALYSRQYNELPSVSANVTCQVSFNGGSNYQATTDSTIIDITNPGSSLIVRLTNASTSRLSIGTWAWDPLESTCRHASLSIL